MSRAAETRVVAEERVNGVVTLEQALEALLVIVVQQATMERQMRELHSRLGHVERALRDLEEDGE